METVTIKEYFEKVLSEKDKAINIALAAAKEAVGVAEKNAEKWRSASNEWRAAMNDRERTFVSRTEFNAYKEGVENALKVEKERSDKNEGKGTGVQQFIGWIIAAIAIAAFVIKNMN